MITLEKYISKHLTGLPRAKRERIVIGFSKNGVDQEWELFFNNDRLLTDRVYTSYNPCTYLKSVENCKTLEDVLTFLYDYSFSPNLVNIKSHLDLLSNPNTNLSLLKQIVDFDIDITNVRGTIYYGQHTINIDCGHVEFIYRGTVNDGTHKFNGKKDFLQLIHIYVNRNYLNVSKTFFQSAKMHGYLQQAVSILKFVKERCEVVTNADDWSYIGEKTTI